MRGRVETLLNRPLAGMWMGTFHGLAHRFLRAHWEAAGLPESFQIIDSEDQLRLIRRIHKSIPHGILVIIILGRRLRRIIVACFIITSHLPSFV